MQTRFEQIVHHHLLDCTICASNCTIIHSLSICVAQGKKLKNWYIQDHTTEPRLNLIFKKTRYEEVKPTIVEFQSQSTQSAVDKQYHMNSWNKWWMMRLKPI